MFITISRQYAAGGSYVAARVADELGWTVVDDAFVDEVAARTGYSREEISELEERVPSFIERFAESSSFSFPENLLSSRATAPQPGATQLAAVTRELVEELGRRDRIVLVGRAAAAVLARADDAIHARLVAPIEYRVRQAIERLGADEKTAAERVAETDENRERYHREYYGRNWNDPVNYHLVLNTGALGPDGAADIIVSRARAVGW